MDRMDVLFGQQLAEALKLDLPYPDRHPLISTRAAAVLLLFGRWRQNSGDVGILITRRTETVGNHKGQMAFPGGVCESDELGGGEGAVKAALRETQEELGILSADVAVLGRLPALVTITRFEVTPVVGWSRIPIEDVQLKLNADEIAEARWISWAVLLSKQTHHVEFVPYEGKQYAIQVFQVDEYRIWGATGSMIKNLLDRFRALS
ncbi:CoA pyrophosphatase [Bdellovibrionota bacterium FG-1]